MPGADVGVIRTSTSNVRQRIQTIGRMIRKKESGRVAEVWIIFVKDTTDERIFLKHDWEDELPEVEDVQTYWELEETADLTEGFPLLELKGGVELLPQPDRDDRGGAPSHRRGWIGLWRGLPRPSSDTIDLGIVRVDETGEMTVMDGGAPSH